MQAMSKTAVLAKLPIKPDAKDTFLDAFGAMLDAVESEEGTEIYILNWFGHVSRHVFTTLLM